jgi:aspartate carbamoyltransferase regulatory subunit
MEINCIQNRQIGRKRTVIWVHVHEHTLYCHQTNGISKEVMTNVFEM